MHMALYPGRQIARTIARVNYRAEKSGCKARRITLHWEALFDPNMVMPDLA